jgi:hypothetical protein
MTLKIAAIPLVLLLSVGLSGCDEYDSVEQCRVKEMQKCKTNTCNAMAIQYCEKLFKQPLKQPLRTIDRELDPAEQKRIRKNLVD